ncbi:MAG: hypothetical protein ABIP93_18040 [Gemmatimonadaceae bacterium]
MRSPTTPTDLLCFAFAAVATLAGCADVPTATLRATELQASRAGAGATVERPWKGRCDVETVVTKFGPTGPTEFYQTGTCQLAHLGRTTVVTNETRVSGGTAVTSTFTAANGDLLYTTGFIVATRLPGGIVTLIGTYTAVGGTGRFAGASGTAVFDETARIDPAGGPTVGAYTLDGRLTY